MPHDHTIGSTGTPRAWRRREAVVEQHLYHQLYRLRPPYLDSAGNNLRLPPVR
jgi:hypothetical protein